MFRINTSHTAAVALFAALLVIFASPMFVQGATIISGTTSGTWSPSGNPYIVAAYTEVTSGNTLTIEPGVEVVIGPDVEFRINGVISAVGTYDEPIIFRGTSSSNYWEQIFVVYYGGLQSVFEYCDFSDAKKALYLYVSSGNRVMETEVHNCTFQNCTEYSVYGTAIGSDSGGGGSAYLKAAIKNCSFTGSGCEFRTNRGHYGYRGNVSPTLIGNIFTDIPSFAIKLTVGEIAGNGSQKIFNNVFNNCGDGVSTVSPYNSAIINNIFIGCSSAVKRTGSNSLDVNYNGFYNNIADFTGYESTYGQVIWSNDNGDPSDLFYNIFMDPQFEPGSYELSDSSPCIDAGDSSITDYYNPILGSSVSDMGAYGGEEPGAGVPPSPPVIVTQPQSTSVFLGQDVIFEVEAVGYDLYYQWYFGGTELVGETTDTFSLTAVEFADAGNYYCTVSNVYDVVNSVAANLRVTEIGLDIAMHAGLHMTNLVVGTTYSIQAVPSLSDTNWVEIASMEAAADNDVWYDPEPADQQSKFYQVKSQP